MYLGTKMTHGFKQGREWKPDTGSKPPLSFYYLLREARPMFSRRHTKKKKVCQAAVKLNLARQTDVHVLLSLFVC